jgi:hypothetical protein
MNIEQTINDLKAKPILFKPDMVRAIREDRKTETMIIINPKNIYWDFNINKELREDLKETKNNCKYGKPGNYLWVRETWREEFFTVDHTQRYDHKYYYKSDNEKFYSSYGEEKIFKWKSSIYMPKSACRLILKIEYLVVERIQDWDKNVLVFRIKFSKYIQL